MSATEYNLQIAILHTKFSGIFYKINSFFYIFAKKMTTPEILNVGVYRHAQKGTQKVPVLFLGLYMKGLVKSTVYYPDGTLCRKVDGIVDNPPPRLSISTPGFSSDFEYEVGS